MFESAESDHAVDPARYDEEVEELRVALLAAQAKVLLRAESPVIVLIAGFEAAGKGDTLQILHQWMDPRSVRATAFDSPDCVEREHPPMWRFWRALPRAGTTAVFVGGWYRDAMYGRVYGGEKRRALERRLDAIVRFERMLTDEGALLVKLWLHLSEKQQRQKLDALAGGKRTRWRVKPSDLRNAAHYDDFRAVAGEMIERTSAGAASWEIIAADDDHHRRLAVGRALLTAMRGRLAVKTEARAPTPPPRTRVPEDELGSREHGERDAMDKDEYEARVARAQAGIAEASRRLAKSKRASVVVFEGSDAAGKGGAIRRLTEALDARHYRVNAVAAPTDEERAFPYLWRFWTRIPRDGEIGIFDRSWYGRTLVERVEGFATRGAWTRAFSEINDFEADLVAHGVIVLKLWLEISKDEQLRRFKAREDEGYKRYKLTAEDWRNRRKWDAYAQAATETIERTSTRHAPWTVVPANDKRCARVLVLETFASRLRGALDDG